MVALSVSDRGLVHEFQQDVVLAIASGLLGRSAFILDKMRVAKGEVVEFPSSFLDWHAHASFSNVDFEPWHCTNFHFPENSLGGSDCVSFRSFVGITHCLLMICCIASICRSI